MSVRRLAEEHVQPEGFAFTKENDAWAKRTIALYPEGRQASAVIPLLMRAQDQEGWVTRAAIETVAEMLGMAYIRVLEVATFYTQFQLEPVGTSAHIMVCGTTPCMLRGAEDLVEVCRNKIHAQPHHLNADGTMSWEEVECLGACVNAPMVMIGQDTYEDLTVKRFGEIVDAFAAGKGDTIEPGPQIVRQFSAAYEGATTLTELNGATATKAMQSKTSKKPAAKARSSSDKPMFEAPKGKADDLKLISGVGPGLEKKLNDLGITTYKQVAELTQEQIDEVNTRLSFKGRVERDDWLAQADALATGGVEEYVKRFGKEPR